MNESTIHASSMITRIDNPNQFVGLSLDDARSQISGYGYYCTVVQVDGRLRMTPQGGYDPLRIKLHLQDNRVTRAEIG